MIQTSRLILRVDCAQLLAMATDVASGLAHLESIEYIHRYINLHVCIYVYVCVYM